jgi:hypothetical protein
MKEGNLCDMARYIGQICVDPHEELVMMLVSFGVS